MKYSLFERWKIAIRPKTLPAAMSPVVMGSALAIHDKQFHLLAAVAALSVALLLQILSNLVNDLFDYIRGVDDDNRLGPARVTQMGIIPRNEMIFGISIIVILTGLVGIYLVSRAGLPLLILGVLAIVSAFAYTGGPYPLGYHGFGDLFVFIFFGLVATIGTYYLQALEINLAVVFCAVGVGFLIVNILVVNNYRDFDTDSISGKTTMAVRLGKKGTRYQFITLGGLAYLVLLPVVFFGYPIWCLIFPLFTIPRFLQLINNLYTQKGRILNKSLAKSSELALMYSTLFLVGVLLPPVIYTIKSVLE